MLESLVASILNRFLKNYVSNLNYDQLKIGMWKGEVHLRDLKLRRDALDKLDLPINVSEGFLGELTLVIPWSNLRNEPVKVIIDHVYLLAEPKSDSTVTLEEEEERIQELKRRRLSTAEMLESPEAQQQSKESNNKGGNGFLAQLTTKVVDNLQFTMKNIHIRYEDKISDPGHPFAAGITLKELSALSTDENWNPKFISDPTSTINKLATLESLSVYWNTDSRSLAGMHHEEAAQVFTDLIPTSTTSPKEHQYILKPVSGKGKIKLNKNFGNEVPKTDVTLLFDELAFGLDDHQYRDAILMIDLFHANLKKRKYLKFHPEKGKTAKTHPREFLEFAGKAILSEVHEKNYKWTWDHFRTRRDQRLKYIECYVAEKTKRATEEQSNELSKLEHDLSFEDIRFYRSLAKSKIRREKIRIEKENEKKKAETAKAGWWGWLSGANPNTDKEGYEDNNDDGDTDSIHITEEQKKELYNAIEYDEDKASIASAVDIPKDTIKFLLKTELKRGSFTLKQDIKKKEQTDLVSIVFDAVNVNLVQYIESLKIGAALGDFQLFDGATKGTIYPQLIGVKKRNSRNSSLLDIEDYLKEDKRRTSGSLIDTNSIKRDEPFFSVVFEKKPLSNKADNAITLKMRHLEIIYSPIVIAGIIDFFKPPSSRMESVNALIAVAGDTFEELKLQTRAGLEFALEHHTTLDLDVDMDAPIIIVPESLTSQDSSVMIIDAGHINVDSQLADKEVVHGIKSKDATTYNQQDIDTLENLMYDKFNLQLSQTKVLIGNNTKECLWQLNGHPPRNGVDARFIERIDMNFLIELCILPGKTEYTKIKVSGQLPLLSINLSDSKYKILMKIVDFAVPKTEADPDSTTDKTRPQLKTASPTSNSNILGERLWGSQNKEILFPDSDSASLDSHLGSQGGISISTSDVEQFKLTFKVDKVLAAVHETQSITEETLLCHVLLENFELAVITRPNDLLVDVSLKALSVEDKMDHEGDFQYLITSGIIDRKQTVRDLGEKKLVDVHYIKASKDHPQFSEVYQSYDQTIDVFLSTLTVVVTRKSILRIYNWIMNTFTGPPTPPDTVAISEEGEEYDGDVFYDEYLSIDDEQASNSQPKDKLKVAIVKPEVTLKPDSNRMKVAIHMDGVNLVLNNEGKRLGTVELSFGELLILLEPNTIEVNGKFGNFTLSDDTKTSNSNNSSSEILSSNDTKPIVPSTYIISIVGDALADFKYKTYDTKSSDFPGFNQKFILRMGAIQILMTDSVKPTLSFLQEFLEMKTVYDAARLTAMETAQQYQEGNSRFHFDIGIKSPVVIFPADKSQKTETLIAHLGEIRARNEFTTVSRYDLKNLQEPVSVPITHIICGLYDISLRSAPEPHNTSTESTENESPIIDDLDIVFDIKSIEDTKYNVGPATQVEGNISDVGMKLTEIQYKTLLETWYLIQRDFLSAPTTDDHENVDKEQNDGDPGDLNKPKDGSQRETVSATSSSQSHSSSNTEISKNIDLEANINLSLSVKLSTVCLEIFTDREDKDKEGLVMTDNYALSRLAFNNISLKMQSNSDESMLMEVSMQSISFSDTRMESKSKFKEILPANEMEGPQFQFKMLSFKHQNVPITDMNVTVDSPKIVLSLDYLFLLKDFFMSPFVVIEPTEAQKYAQSHSRADNNEQIKQQKASQATATAIHLNVNVVNLQVLCLATPERESSEAVILSFNQLKVIQKTNLQVDLNGIGMVLCRMDNVEESTMHFVEKFDVILKVDNASTSPIHNLTSIMLNVQQIVLRLSYQDLMLITTIANKVMALMGAPNANDAPKPSVSDDASEIAALPPNIIVADDASSTELHDNDSSPSRAKGIEPFIVMSKEKLVATFEGVQVILIEDLHDLPFVDVHVSSFTAKASDWSRSIAADVDIDLRANNFNFKNSHWEPIIEPWTFCIKVRQDSTDKSTHVALNSEHLLTFNFTHAFLESLLAISETLSEIKPLAETAQVQVKPYLLRNFTGYNLQLWNMSDDAEKAKTEIHELPQGETMTWTFRDWKKRRERINLGENQFGLRLQHYEWEKLLHIPVDREGEFAYRLRPTINGIDHRLIVDIHLHNHVKYVTFRSGLSIENTLTESVQLAIVNKDRKLQSDIINLESKEIYNVPIALSYSYWILIRPSDQYEWSKHMLMWSDLLMPSFPKYVECPSVASDQAAYNYQLNPVIDKTNLLAKRYPMMKIQICPPIQVENLLPFDFNLTLTEEATSRKYYIPIESGKIAHLYNIKNDASVSVQVEIKSDRYNISESTTITATPNFSVAGKPLVIRDQNDVPTNLKLNVSRTTSTADTLNIAVYAPYLIINKSGLDISLRSRQSYRQANTHVEEIPAYKEGQAIVPAIFSYPDSSHQNRAQISINKSKWSDPISFEAVGNSQDVTLLSKTDNLARHAGIKVEEGLGVLRLTKIVTITPRYILKNNTRLGLTLCEFGEESSITIDPDNKLALYQTSKSSVRWLCLKLHNVESNWSAPFDIQEIGKTFVKVERGDGSLPYLIRVLTHIRDSSIYITFNLEEEWPYCIINKSSVEVSFKQDEVEIDDYSLTNRQKKALKLPSESSLSPGNKVQYSWDIPVAKDKRLYLRVGNRHRSVNFQAIGMQVPFRYAKQRDVSHGYDALAIEVMADNSALVLLLTDYDKSKNIYRPKSSAASTLASTSREGSIRDSFETIDVQHIVNYVIEFKLAGFGISIINRHAQELAYATIKGLDLKYTDSNMYQSIRLGLRWLQIDNQLYSSTYPILCYPTTLPKVAHESSAHPALHIALDKVKDDRHGVQYFKTFSILLQELSFEIDEDFLYALMDFAQFDSESKPLLSQNAIFVMKIEEPVADKEDALYYFEEFCIQPMRLNLSFVRTDNVNETNSNASNKNSPVGYVFNVLTMTLGNINDAPIKLNALMVENLRASSEDLTARIMLHYKDQIVYQVHRVLGSIDILGNPVGLFNTLSSGFGELFYEPYQGFIMSDRPQDLGIGIAKGVGGFVKKGLFGITDSMSRFTGSLGKGLSAATMDKKFQDKRRMNLTRNKPTHAIYGVTQGVGYFGTSVASGFAGLVKRPIEGAESGGVTGFVGGVGKGLVGAFTKPVVGFLDMASNITAGIRETTTVFEGGDLKRERLPRFTGKDGIITSYSQREALGQMWLKEMESGKFSHENYLAHSTLENDETIAILTYTRILVVRADNLKLNYIIPLEQIKSAAVCAEGVQLQFKSNHQVLAISESTKREWFARIIEQTLEQCKEELEKQ
ncbi:hypothetical protein EDC96DRAFT_608831 [Choanephora cucurbitarum]|nr:hypothetical protein EDC96DRAFT_608831 [Choanephora cucurbitarum]